jgi:hypothetical protein
MGPTCGSKYDSLHKVADIHSKHLQQISVKFVQILKCERRILVLGFDSQRGAHMWI